MMNKKQITRHLFRLVEEVPFPLDFIREIAGDRDLSATEEQRFKELQKRYGGILFAEMIFKVTHQYYPPEKAEAIWDEIIRHKERLSEILGRNVGLVVASLDYLSNIRRQLDEPTVISKATVTSIAELAMRDSLTRLYDHATFLEKLATEVERYKRYKISVSVMMLDIDNFKDFNDRYGHQQGDEILQQIATLLRRGSRNLDLCARYGGEEFALMLSQTPLRKAVELAERLRTQIADQIDAPSQVTVSIGVASCPKHAQDVKGLVRKADQALYHSKNSGKNRVSVFYTIEMT